MHRHVDIPRFVKAAYARLFNHQKLPFKACLEDLTPYMMWWHVDQVHLWFGMSNHIPSFSSLSLSLPSSNSVSIPSKIKTTLQFILPSHFILILFITIFLFLISYKITNVLQFHHIIF